jgi:8-oxo-dGTP pyrophosphatase MutT (NUDIX family)
MKERREFAAGGVVGRAGKLLLVQVRNLEGELRWTFPKGHLEKGETWLEAALREVEEETGWRCRSAGALSSASYRFRRGAHPVFKRVKWYRMETVAKTGRPDADEIRRARWFDAARAEKILSYPSDLRVLARYQENEPQARARFDLAKSRKIDQTKPSKVPGGDR